MDADATQHQSGVRPSSIAVSSHRLLAGVDFAPNTPLIHTAQRLKKFLMRCSVGVNKEQTKTFLNDV